MTKIKQAVKAIAHLLKGKKVLEASCGSGEFSVEAADLAESVDCIDLVQYRLDLRVSRTENMRFTIMDAANMTFEDGSFDTVVMYNVVTRLHQFIHKVLDECFRVLKKGGSLCIISSFRMDKVVITGMLIPLFESKGKKLTVTEEDGFIYVIVDAD